MLTWEKGGKKTWLTWPVWPAGGFCCCCCVSCLWHKTYETKLGKSKREVK